MVRALRQVRLEGRLDQAIGLWFSNGFDSETLPGRMRAIYARLSAELYATVGDFDEAMRLVVRADELGSVDLMWLEHCPTLAPLRDRPAYATTLANMRARVASTLSSSG